jgi:hypothetical protein
MKRPRTKPYTERGIRRMPCFRCSAPSAEQWQICADSRVFRPCCVPCDVELNELVLRWAGDPDVDAKMAAYRLRMMPGA